MNRLVWWMRIVGVFYVLQFVMMAIVRAPIRTFGPAGALDLADAGDPVATFLVYTWFTFGTEVAAVGIALLIASLYPEQARGVVWTVLGIETLRGIANDLYFIARGFQVGGYLIWIAIHTVVIVTGLLALRASRSNATEPSDRRATDAQTSIA
ncbi:MAG: BphX family protein [Actinobacteria bacterium]|nr:BphX family protein [Actinomycetota bacterium]